MVTGVQTCALPIWLMRFFIDLTPTQFVLLKLRIDRPDLTIKETDSPCSLFRFLYLLVLLLFCTSVRDSLRARLTKPDAAVVRKAKRAD